MSEENNEKPTVLNNNFPSSEMYRQSIVQLKHNILFSFGNYEERLMKNRPPTSQLIEVKARLKILIIELSSEFEKQGIDTSEWNVEKATPKELYAIYTEINALLNKINLTNISGKKVIL